MWFSAFKKERLDSLKATPRVLGGNDPNNPGLNFVDGLLDLIEHTKPQVVLEIGSNAGVSTECFLLTCPRVIAVDPWDNAGVYDEFMRRCGAYPNLEWHRKYSYQLDLKSNSVDMVYIDGLHDYWSVYNDIKIAETVLKKGGWFAGHDYVKENPPVNTEVPRAVLEIFGREPDKVFSDTSWVIRKE